MIQTRVRNLDAIPLKTSDFKGKLLLWVSDQNAVLFLHLCRANITVKITKTEQMKEFEVYNDQS